MAGVAARGVGAIRGRAPGVLLAGGGVAVSELTKVRAVELRAELRQIKTMVDHSCNITLNVPEDCKEQVKTMLDWLGNEVRLVIENIS